MTKAKLFKVGGSQAVRLPKDFRMPGEEVDIRWSGTSLILDPVPNKPGRTKAEIAAWLAEIQALAGGEPIERDQPPPQERDWSKFD